MRERPILFSAPMVRALLDDRKTQTRRVVKPAPAFVAGPGALVGAGDIYACRDAEGAWGIYQRRDGQPRSTVRLRSCPYGAPGDQLWVRESWKAPERLDQTPPREIRPGTRIAYVADDRLWPVARYRPSIHMPRWASRISLRITDVRVERLDAISEADALAEGIGPMGQGGFGVYGDKTIWRATAAGAYRDLWEKINGALGDADPWVWAVTFERVT